MHTTPLQALEGTRVLSLALNLPGPAALQRCRAMGAQCHKLEPLAPAGLPLPSAPGVVEKLAQDLPRHLGG